MFSDTIARLGHAPMFLTDDRHSTLSEVRAKALHLRDTEGQLGLVVVDHAHRLRPGPDGDLPTGGAGGTGTSRDLKSLAVTLDTPILAVAQLSQGARVSRRLVGADLSVPGTLDAAADVALILGRRELAGRPDGPNRRIDLHQRGRLSGFQDLAARPIQQLLPF
jgi:replicative DNA helicase